MRQAFAVIAAFVFLAFSVTSSQGDPAPEPDKGAEKRVAFVVGNESYAAGALPTAANDAGLIAQTLQAAGFEVVGARDLDAETLRQSYGDFLKKVSEAGKDAVAFVYLAGYGVQYGTDNYFVPIGASMTRAADIPIETIRLSDLTGPLNAMDVKARFMVFDAAYKSPFESNGPAFAGGFSLVDAAPGSLVAYNAAPGTVAPVEKGNYGVYAQSLAATLREGGLAPDAVFERVRLRVNEASKGVVVPWDTSKIDVAFRFFDRADDAPKSQVTADQMAALNDKPIKTMSGKDAYTAAIARDSIESYSDFLSAHPDNDMAKRARVLLAARREAQTWRKTCSVNTPAAYYSYKRRYKRGMHARDADMQLQALSAPAEPPPDYEPIDYDVPPPPPDELDYVDQPEIYLADPAYDYGPPPPPPDYWVPPVPVDFLDLAPPPPPLGLFFLPVPVFVPIPVYYNPPPFVVYPAYNYFYAGGPGPGATFYSRRGNFDRRAAFAGIHQGYPAGGPANRGGGDRGGRGFGVAVPRAVSLRSEALEKRGITTPAQLRAARQDGELRRGGEGRPGAEGKGKGLSDNQKLPGAGGRPLPDNTKGQDRNGPDRNGGARDNKLGEGKGGEGKGGLGKEGEGKEGGKAGRLDGRGDDKLGKGRGNLDKSGEGKAGDNRAGDNKTGRGGKDTAEDRKGGKELGNRPGKGAGRVGEADKADKKASGRENLGRETRGGKADAGRETKAGRGGKTGELTGAKRGRESSVGREPRGGGERAGRGEGRAGEGRAGEGRGGMARRSGGFGRDSAGSGGGRGGGARGFEGGAAGGRELGRGGGGGREFGGPGMTRGGGEGPRGGFGGGAPGARGGGAGPGPGGGARGGFGGGGPAMGGGGGPAMGGGGFRGGGGGGGPAMGGGGMRGGGMGGGPAMGGGGAGGMGGGGMGGGGGFRGGGGGMGGGGGGMGGGGGGMGGGGGGMGGGGGGMGGGRGR